jgi:hypothetical protein
MEELNEYISQNTIFPEGVLKQGFFECMILPLERNVQPFMRQVFKKYIKFIR